MKEKYYKKLVDGYLHKKLSKEELAVFFDLMSKGELDSFLEDAMERDIDSASPKIEPFTKYFKIIKVAAIFLFISSLSLVLYTGIGNKIFYDPKNEISITPGFDQAILTLSDGSQISLMSASQSVDIADKNVKIAKNKTGVLVYDLSKIDFKSTENEYLLEKFNTIETPKGGTYKVILPDGSEVWLNSFSRIKFPLAFSKLNRLVEIDGEAYFKVVQDQNKPFIVHHRNQDIKVLGTEFNVNTYKDEPSIKTTLIEGSVSISTGSQVKRLIPGQEALNIGNQIQVRAADVDQATAWKEGYFNFNKVDIQTLMRQISRWYNIEVKYTGEITSETFVGKIKRTESLESIVNIFKKAGLDIQTQERLLLIKY